MAKDVILTPIAIEDIDKVVDYLTYKWGITVANDFIDRFAEIINLLSKNPELFPFVDKNKHLQRCIVTKHNILYFTETENNIKTTPFLTPGRTRTNLILFFRIYSQALSCYSFF